MTTFLPAPPRTLASQLEAPVVRLPDVSSAALESVKAAMVEHWGAERVEKAVRPLDWARYAVVLDQVVGSSLLDVGCSHGVMLEAAAIDGGLTLAGLDRRLGWLARPVGWTPFVANATSLPFGARSWDTVTALEMLEHQTDDDVPRVLAELRRVVARRLILTVPLCQRRLSGGHLQTFCPDRLRRLFPTATFTVLEKGDGAAYDWVMVVEAGA